MKSKVGSGSCFYFTIPVKTVKLDETLRLKSEEKVNNIDEFIKVHGKKRVLLIDDDIENYKLFKLFLKGTPFEILGTTDEDKGLKMAKAEDFDIVILDLNMPKYGGEELLKRIKTMPRFKDIPVLCLTGESREGVEQRLIELGFSQFVKKPIGKEKFINLLLSLFS